MKLLLAALVGTVVTFGTLHSSGAAEVPALHTAVSRVRSWALEVTRSEPAAPAEATAPEAPEGVRLDAPVHVRVGRKTISIPQTCRDSAGRYDLVIHFHGAPETVEPAFQSAGLNATFVVVNLGIGSGPYEDAFMTDGSLERLLGELDQVMAKQCPSESGARGRVALSAWSAGYGAVYRVLASKHDRELVDAVLLADGLHAGFLDKFHQHMNAGQMAPFDAFAARAVKGEKLFAITHTAIVPPSYASTTETASWLIAQRGLERSLIDEAGPRPKMRLRSRVDQGGFHVRGYAGNDTNAHCDHLYAMGDTLFSTLEARWTAR